MVELTPKEIQLLLLNVMTDIDDFCTEKDISYYMIELDFGKKWQQGMIIQDGKDIKLQNSHDLWNLIQETKK